LEEEKVKGFAKAMSSVNVADGLSMLYVVWSFWRLVEALKLCK